MRSADCVSPVNNRFCSVHVLQQNARWVFLHGEGTRALKCGAGPPSSGCEHACEQARAASGGASTKKAAGDEPWLGHSLKRAPGVAKEVFEVMRDMIRKASFLRTPATGQPPLLAGKQAARSRSCQIREVVMRTPALVTYSLHHHTCVRRLLLALMISPLHEQVDKEAEKAEKVKKRKEAKAEKDQPVLKRWVAAAGLMTFLSCQGGKPGHHVADTSLSYSYGPVGGDNLVTLATLEGCHPKQWPAANQWVIKRSPHVCGAGRKSTPAQALRSRQS